MSAPIRREPFELVQEPRVPGVGRLVGMLVRFQSSLLEAFAQLWQLPFVGVGAVQVIVGPLASSGTIVVQHGLKRVPRGWLVLDVVRATGATGDLVLYRRAGDALDARVLTLYASNSFETLTLLVWP